MGEVIFSPPVWLNIHYGVREREEVRKRKRERERENEKEENKKERNTDRPIINRGKMVIAIRLIWFAFLDFKTRFWWEGKGKLKGVIMT